MGTRASRGIAIANQHDSSAYARAFQRAGRVRVSAFLSGAAVARDAIANANFSRVTSPPNKSSFNFEALPLDTPPSPGPLEPLIDFVTSDALANFLRAVAGVPAGKITNLCATRFRAGDYMVGLGPNESRPAVAAFSLDLTTSWVPDWGGLHLFIGENGNVDQGFAPEFNSLTLFRVPQNQFVSQVSDDVAQDRLTITGLLTD